MLRLALPGSACRLSTRSPARTESLHHLLSASRRCRSHCLFLMRHALCNKCRELPAHSMTSGKPFALFLQAAPTGRVLTRAKWFNSSVCVTVSDEKKYRAKDQPPLQRDLLCFDLCSIHQWEKNIVSSSLCPGESQGSMVHVQGWHQVPTPPPPPGVPLRPSIPDMHMTAREKQRLCSSE